MRRCIALLALLITLLVGCGSDDDGSGAQDAAAQQRAAARQLLDSWSKQLEPNFLLQRDRARASRAGDQERAVALERRILRGLRPVEKYGRDARKQFIDSPRTPVARAVTAAGDAWTEWAYTIRTDPPRGDFDKARRLADLGRDAVRAHQRAYSAIGADVPPFFQG